MNKKLAVREITLNDIPLIADYWLAASPAYLTSMGVDLGKLPAREALTNMLRQQIATPLAEKASYAMVWLVDGSPVGHANVNLIQYGQSAYMHLHLWKAELRQQGMGTALVRKSLPHFFENLQLQELYCEPYALNPAPNKTLSRVGFTFEKRYRTIPGSLNFEQEVNRYKLTRERFKEIKHTCL
ncbi:GNAT family N-acetyltransferase [Pontibacter sp. CAU 1760]